MSRGAKIDGVRVLNALVFFIVAALLLKSLGSGASESQFLMVAIAMNVAFMASVLIEVAFYIEGEMDSKQESVKVGDKDMSMSIASIVYKTVMLDDTHENAEVCVEGTEETDDDFTSFIQKNFTKLMEYTDGEVQCEKYAHVAVEYIAAVRAADRAIEKSIELTGGVSDEIKQYALEILTRYLEELGIEKEATEAKEAAERQITMALIENELTSKLGELKRSS